MTLLWPPQRMGDAYTAQGGSAMCISIVASFLSLFPFFFNKVCIFKSMDTNSEYKFKKQRLFALKSILSCTQLLSSIHHQNNSGIRNSFPPTSGQIPPISGCSEWIPWDLHTTHIRIGTTSPICTTFHIQ